MKRKLRLGLLGITTLLTICAVNAQITFVNPPADTTVTCNNFISFPGEIEVTDDCAGNPFVFFNDVSTRITATDTCAFYEYTVTRTFSAMNSCADTSKYVQIITVIDTIAPLFTPPPPVTINCSDLNNLSIAGDIVNFTDQCGGPISKTYVDEMKPIRCDSTITRTWIVSDVCGNSRTGTQLITVIDNQAPVFVNQPRDLSVMCSMTENPYPVFNEWVDNMAFASFNDACNVVSQSFAAVPGSYDLNDPATFPGEHPGGLNAPECGVVDGAVQFETVDFVILDICGNATSSSATFFYVDDESPSLDNCPNDVTVTLDNQECFTSFSYGVPTSFDTCGTGDLIISISDSQDISSSDPGNEDVVVEDLEFRLGPYGPEVAFNDDENFFTVQLSNVDAEDTGETFLVLDENGEIVGITPNAANECGTFDFELGPFSADKMNSWTEDKYIHFTFTASENEAPSNSVNDICTGGTIEISKEYTIRTEIDPVQMFLGINEEAFTLIEGDSVDFELNAGIHVVKYMAVDCAGNSTTCPQRVTITDNTNPQLNCGVSRQVDADNGTCGFSLPLSEIAIINNPCDENIMVNVSIEGAMTALYSGAYENMKDSIITFPLGASIIQVNASDFSQNESSCTFNLQVNDNELPNAVCETTEIPVVAVALEDLVLDPMLVAGNSSDNCGIDDISIEDNSFTCDDLGSFFSKTVTITDESNNSSSCIANFSLVPSDIPISYTVGICPEDSLQFHLHIPQKDDYVYGWEGPFGFSSVLAEPFVPDVQTFHEGLYTLTIRNKVTGCESTGSVEVFVDDLKEPNLYTDAIGCETLPHVLSTDKVEGDNIRYDWYEFSGTSRTLLASSDSSFIGIDLDPGQYTLGVVVVNSFCESRPSNRIVVDVRETPDGAICSNLVEGCIGLPLELCVQDPEDQFIISWIGPNGFESDEAMPVVTDSFTPAFSGVYKLVIEDNLCITDTLTTSVTTNITPEKPEILGEVLYCPGETLTLTSSLTDEDYIYVWSSPTGVIRNNNSTLEIPNAGSNFNGAWTLSIESGPCTSIMSDPVFIDIEPIQSFNITTDPVQCTGAEVLLTSNGSPGSMFEWQGPNGFTSNLMSPTLEIIEGTYTARMTTANRCVYTDELFINTVVIPDIFGVEVSEEGPCLDPNSDITIIPTLNQSADVFYEWNGPNVSSTSSSLTINGYTMDDNGVYSVKVLNGACESPLFTFPLTYIVSPDQPEIETDPIACIGDSLNLITADYGDEASYDWTTPDGNIQTTTNLLGLGNVSTALSGSYSVRVTIGECTSPTSEIVDITVNENIFVPNIITSGEECLQSELKIFADLSGDLELQWELPTGSIVVTDTLFLDLEASDSGNYRVRSLSNGCFSEWSSPLTIDVADPRIGLSLFSDFIFSCNNDDSGLEFCVEDNSGLSGQKYMWYLGEVFLGETTNLCYQVEDYEIFAFGLNEVNLKVEYNDCIVDFDEPLLLEIENVRDIDFSAGNDQLYCVGEGLIMNADEVSTSKLSAFWSGDGTINIDDIDDPMATITVLEDIDSTYAIWNVEHIECGVVYRDTVTLRQKVKPIPVTDTLVMDNDNIEFNPLENDDLISGNNYEVTEVSDPRWGSVSFTGTEIRYSADPKFIGGAINFTYTVCDDACEVLCSDGEVILLYNAESCKGNNVLTPNNDGANDRFIIPCVEEEDLPESSLVIINEVGNTIYEQSPYDNSWDGTFNGEPLAEGTYYYIFRKNNNASVVQGFISIER